MNKVFMIGRLAADPELRTTQSGTPVATYRLAVNRRRSAEATQEADFFPCVAWGKGAEFAAKYMRRGMKIAIAGRLQTRAYDAQNGTKRYVTEIIVDEHEFCESRGAAAPEQAAPAAPSAPAAQNARPADGGYTQVDDDELPF